MFQEGMDIAMLDVINKCFFSLLLELDWDIVQRHYSL